MRTGGPAREPGERSHELLMLDQHDAILFDMDGTLVDTERLWFTAGVVVAQRFGAALPEEAAGDLHGLDVDALAQHLRGSYGLQADDDVFRAELLGEVVARLAGAACRPGAGNLVERVAASDRLRALVSNSSHEVIEATLAPHEWARLLRRRFSVDDVPRGKPHPDLYLHAARSLEVEPGRCLAIEDSLAGAMSATSAGMSCIVVTFGLVPEAAFEDVTPHVVPSLAAAQELLFAPGHQVG